MATAVTDPDLQLGGVVREGVGGKGRFFFLVLPAFLPC